MDLSLIPICYYQWTSSIWKYLFSVVLGYGDFPTSRKGEGKVQVREDVQGGKFWGCGKSSLSGLMHSIFIKIKYGLSCISSWLFSKWFDRVIHITGGISTPYGHINHISIPDYGTRVFSIPNIAHHIWTFAVPGGLWSNGWYYPIILTYIT